MALFIGKVSPSLTSETLRSLFAEYGNVIRVDLRKSHAFITYDSMSSAEKAMVALKGKEVEGSR